MSQITLRDLEQMNACKEARVAFRKHFGDATTLPHLVMALIEHKRGVAWWEWLAPRLAELGAAWEVYENAVAPVRHEYEGRVRKARVAFDAVEFPARLVAIEAGFKQEAWDAYQVLVRPARQQYKSAVRRAEEAYVGVARRALLEVAAHI